MILNNPFLAHCLRIKIVMYALISDIPLVKEVMSEKYIVKS